VIRSFRDKRTERFAEKKRVKEFHHIAERARNRLALLEAAASISELAAIPGNRLELLKGDRAGQYSIRINDQWRVCFVWNEAAKSADQVEIVDYH
jgi:proteic killer suppression protein